MAPAELQIEVVYCPAPGVIDQRRLCLAAGATVAEALQASGLLQAHGLAAEGLQTGVWGRVCGGGTLLRDRDRVEVYRGLHVDPKEARRLRYRQQRETGGGQRRPAASKPR